MYSLTSDITIGNLRFSAVHKVTIKRSIYSLVDTATITLPSLAKITRSGTEDPAVIQTADQFKEGDKVIVRLGYNDNLKTEFAGFVKDVEQGKPVTIRCEGCSWLLKRNPVDTFFAHTTLKELLSALTKDIPDIKVRCEANLSFTKVRLNNTNAFDSLQQILAMCDDTIRCFFVEPGTLWCGLLGSNFADGDTLSGSGTVRYRTGYNAPDNNALRKRDASSDPTQVTYSKRTSSGSVIKAISSVHKNPKYFITRQLNQVSDVTSLTLLAREKALQSGFSGYEGSIQGFLEPYALPGYTAQIITDATNSDTQLEYLVESMEVNFGISGARRKLELGPSRNKKTN